MKGVKIMAKSFELVQVEGFSVLADSIRKSTASARQEISQYLLSNLQHYRANGKKVAVLQEAIDLILTERYRDLDVVEITLRVLSPLSFTTEAAAGCKRKKWINIEGEKNASDVSDPKKVQKQQEQNKARWSNVFEQFAKGNTIAVQNPAFYKGCNDGKKETDLDFQPEKLDENFNQDIYAMVDRMKDIQVEKAQLKAQRDGDSTDSVIAHSEAVGTVKKSLDTLSAKIKTALDKVDLDYINGATTAELGSLDSYAEEMQKKLDAMSEQLDILRDRCGRAKESRAEQEVRDEEEKALALAAEIMARRNAQVETAEQAA